MALKFGRYETIRTIASGGMATVYLGRAVGEGGFERLVAIKVMHPHIATDADFRAMFLDEARLAARIRHPNVVAVNDVQKTDDGIFIVMDYVDGPSLHQLRRGFRRRGTTLPLGVALRIFVDVLTGLHDAHELVDAQGRPLSLVHRDVSPQNILVRDRPCLREGVRLGGPPLHAAPPAERALGLHSGVGRGRCRRAPGGAAGRGQHVSGGSRPVLQDKKTPRGAEDAERDVAPR